MAADDSKTTDHAEGSEPSAPSQPQSKSVQSAPSTKGPKTIKLKRPPANAIADTPVSGAAPSSQTQKDSSTRIEDATTVIRGVASKKDAVAIQEDMDQKTVIKKKKETSRVLLENVGVQVRPDDETRLAPLASDTPTGPESRPETIRLKRPAEIKTGIPGGPPSALVKEETDRISLTEAPTVSRNIALKAETSRIVLDEVVMPKIPGEEKRKTSPIDEMLTPSPSVPKTIKLKRPSSAVPEGETVLKEDAEKHIETAKKLETAEINLPKEEIAPVPITQRKTIKIKRTERNVVPRTVSLSRPGAEVSEETGEEVIPGEVPEEELSIVFSIVAVAAILLVASLVYIMVAQAFGPELILPVPSQLL